jgi:hypothetical protein
MRTLTISSISAALLLVPAAALAVESSGTINYRATATFSDGSSADRLYSVTVADLDGDGVNDEGWLRVACADGAVTAVSYYSVKSPRDAASGMASGKRMHKPFKITAELDRTAGPGAAAVGKTVSWDIKEAKGAKAGAAGKTTYDVKKVEGTGARAAAGGEVEDGKTMTQDDWQQVALRAGSPNLCE